MIKYLEMRSELIDLLHALSDSDYQRNCWVLGDCPPGVIDNFDLAVQFLFDDTQLAQKPELWVGEILKSNIEADAMRNLGDAINGILNVYGTDKSDAEYINTREWSDVIKLASEALKIIVTEH